MNSVWCLTAYLPPNSGYSFLIVCRQCGQVVTMSLGARPFRVSVFSAASWAKRYSLPARRAASPVHFSCRPSTAQLTPAAWRIDAMLWAIFCARGSKAAAQRLDWAKGLPFEVPTVEKNPDPDVLYWVGCAAAFDPRAQKIAQRTAPITHR